MKIKKLKDIANEHKYKNNGKIKIVGICGQAGAGKTQISRSMFSEMLDMTKVEVDWFFHMSREQRKNWLEEGKLLGVEEWQRRSDQINWWSFSRMEETIAKLKNREAVMLNNIYNREDNGNLTGRQIINPPQNGGFIILEGVPVILLENIDLLIFVHAEPKIRKARLEKRDPRKGYATEERWQITQRFETREFLKHIQKPVFFLDNSAESSCPILERPIISRGEVKKSLELQKKQLEKLSSA